LREKTSNILSGIDWITVLLYLVLVTMGWLNIYSAVYNEEHPSIMDMSQKYGKQLLWIGTAFMIGLVILIIDENFYTVFSYGIYSVFLVLIILVPFIGHEVKGSSSWFKVGDFLVQPAEFMKFAASLALAKFLSNQNIRISNYKNTFSALAIIGLPMIIIMKLQNETGLAIVFGAFILAMYREGLSVNYLLLAGLAIVLFTLALMVNNIYLMLIIIGLGALATIFIKRNWRNVLVIATICGVACGMVKATSYVYEHMEDHQKIRIDVLLGRKTVDIKKEGYNINQAKIAIGSGGKFGKGYLEGTQTKYDFVPEQDTDFIFCTVGEEWGFVGCTVVVILFITLIIRIVVISERQRSPFSRIYGYGVASIMFFHVLVNIGMTIGLAPVIGIPLPFFSYGGSSLWSFTILLFILLKLDSHRMEILR